MVQDDPCGLQRVELLRHLDQHKIGTRLLIAGNLTRQHYMKGQHYRVSGDLSQTDIVMNHTFWIGVQPALTEDMLEYATGCIEGHLRGVEGLWMMDEEYCPPVAKSTINHQLSTAAAP